jgi:hypothetical protein
MRHRSDERSLPPHALKTTTGSGKTIAKEMDMNVDGVHGYKSRVASWGAYATHPMLAGFPLRYRKETSIIILDSRTNGKS